MDTHVSWLFKTLTEEDMNKKQKTNMRVYYVFSHSLALPSPPSETVDYKML